ncbi:MAG: caspase family protein, partial [Bacteroidales bacterium]
KLISVVLPGDIVYIHFSTHGQQLAYLNGEDLNDLHSAIALYDARSKCDNNYQGQNHLTDDEFGQLIEQLRKKLGKNGDILVLADACHAGSMSRGPDTTITRGGYPPLILRGNNSTLKLNDSGKKENTAMPQVGMFSGFNLNNDENKANYIIISACEKDEISSEYYFDHNYYGPLTWAFLKAMLNNAGSGYTYKKLFHDIQFETISMFEHSRTAQHPLMESAEINGTDKIIFGGKPIRQERFYVIEKFLGANRIIIPAGKTSGIYDSTTVMVYPSGTADPKKAGNPVSRGVIIQSGYMESVVQLNSMLDISNPGKYWIFIDNKKSNGYEVRLNLGKFTDTQLKNQVSEMLKNFRYVEITSDTPSYILEQKADSNNEMLLKHAQSRKIYEDEIFPDNLGDRIQTIAQAQFLKNLNVSSDGIDMDISLVPFDTVHLSRTKLLNLQTMRTNVREDLDTCFLVLVNTGEKSFYFNIIEFDPEDHFSVSLPGNNHFPSDCFLRPGEKKIINPSYTFQRPLGMELLKIIASEKKFDLRPVINKTDNERSIQGDLESIFDNAYKLRGQPSMPESAEFATFNFFFDIIR